MGAALAQSPTPGPAASASVAPPASAASSADGDPSLEALLRTELQRPVSDVAVSTATRQSQSAELSPALTQVITRQDIQRLGLRTMGDVLRRFIGLQVRDDSLFTRVSVRGIGPGDFNGRVLFLLDGLRLNENIYDAAQIDLDFVLDLSLVERVEFAPGPGSALYGANALLGVVNVVTQRADQLAGAQVRLGLGARGKRDSRWSWATRTEGGWEWVLSASSVDIPDALAPQALDADEARALRPFEWDRARRLMLSVRQGGWLARLGGSDRVRGLATFIPELDRLGQASDQTYFRMGQLAWEGEAWGWDWSSSLAWQQSRYRFDEPWAVRGDDPPKTYRFEALGRWAQGELRAGRTWGEDHYLMAGLEWQRDERQRFRFQVLDLATVDEDESGRRLGVFVQDEWRLAERQRLVLGLRHDRSHPGVNRSSPRLAYLWSPEPGQSLKLLWGSAFRAPNRFERTNNQDAGVPAPRPERVRSTELVWEGRLGADWAVRLSGYHLQLLDPSAQQADGSYLTQAGQRSRGLDLGVERRWDEGWHVQAGLSAQRGRDAAGLPLPLSPRWVAQWRVSSPLWPLGQGGWRGSVYGTAQSAQRDGALRLPGYGLAHAQVLWLAHPQVELSLGVQNIGARRYRDSAAGAGTGAIERRGAQWQLGWVWRERP